jgi:hypothetical protein
MWLLIVILACAAAACTADSDDAMRPIKVDIKKTDAGYQLLRGGKPYAIKGAGMAIDDIERFAARGGNSIRNWTTNNAVQDVEELLDKAHAHGVTVALCLQMVAERHGFDYDDAEAVARQLGALTEEVLKYRDHPALLVWIIGNELNHSYSNPAVFDAVNDVAKMIHELDPNHPTTTALERFDAEVVAQVRMRAPELDFMSFQTYGSLFGLPTDLAATGFEEPFMVTEWGAIGYWEMELASWGAPIEMSSSGRADKVLEANRDVLQELAGQLLGSYIFMWGQKQERTPTWFGLVTETGEQNETADVMQRIWTGSWPDNRSPRVGAMRLDGRIAAQSIMLEPGREYVAEFEVADPDGDALRYHWEVKPESDVTTAGGDQEAPIESLPGLLTDADKATVYLAVPEPGDYRLFAYAYDGQGHAAYANIPFLVVRGEP